MGRLKRLLLEPFFICLVLSLHVQVLSRTIHIAPLEDLEGWYDDDGSMPMIEVDITGLEMQSNFKEITTLHVQLELDGPTWGFPRQHKTSTKNYFVGVTKDRSAKICIYRYALRRLNVTLITGVIHDIRANYWYEVKPNIEGLYLVTVIPDHAEAPFADPILPPPNLLPKQQTAPSISHVYQSSRKLLETYLPWAFSEGDNGNQDEEEDTIIDIMVVWTHQAECIKSYLPADCTISTSTRQNMKLSILFFLQETNTAFANSGLHLRLRLAHAQRVLYHETTFGQALQDLKSRSIPRIHQRREKFKADMVMLVMDQTHDHPETGIAYNNYDHIEADFMYSVVATQYSSVWYLPAHEIGHNFGCSHDRGTVGMCHDEDKTSYGYRHPQGKFRTIMSYPCQARQCDNYRHHDNNKFLCPIIPYFSNSHNHSRYGGAALGGSKNDCAGQINRVKDQIASLY